MDEQVNLPEYHDAVETALEEYHVTINRAREDLINTLAKARSLLFERQDIPIEKAAYTVNGKGL
jgi:hypothetical protein